MAILIITTAKEEVTCIKSDKVFSGRRMGRTNTELIYISNKVNFHNVIPN